MDSTMKPSSGRFRGARSRESAEAQVQSKIDYELHRCGSGSSGSVVARRLQRIRCQVLLLKQAAVDDVQA